MTSGTNSELGKHGDFLIDTSVEKEACPLGLAPTASTTLTLALGDALAVCLLQGKGFTSEMFGVTHPMGLLGRRLLVTVEEVMLKNLDVPKVLSSSTVKDGIVEISRTGIGFVCIENDNGELVGVFTDGDLRRFINADMDINSVIMDTFVNENFCFIVEGKLAVEAVEVMEKNGITSLPVVDQGMKAVGALNMRMILQAGVV